MGRVLYHSGWSTGASSVSGTTREALHMARTCDGCTLLLGSLTDAAWCETETCAQPDRRRAAVYYHSVWEARAHDPARGSAIVEPYCLRLYSTPPRVAHLHLSWILIGSRFKISTQVRTHANKPRNEDTTARDTKAHTNEAPVPQCGGSDKDRSTGAVSRRRKTLWLALYDNERERHRVREAWTLYGKKSHLEGNYSNLCFESSPIPTSQDTRARGERTYTKPARRPYLEAALRGHARLPAHGSRVSWLPPPVGLPEPPTKPS